MIVWLRSYARRHYPDLVDAGARGDIERLFIGVAESDIGGLFRRPDGAEMFAFRRDDPYPAGAGLVEIALGVDPQAVGDSALGFFAHVDEQLAIGEHSVGADLVAIDVIVAAAVDVEIFLVRRKGEALVAGMSLTASISLPSFQ